MAKTLVLGHSGLVGQALLEQDPALAVIDGGREHLDLNGGLEHIKRALQSVKPKVCINCIAMTNVDACEQNPEAAFSLNAIAPGLLALACKALDIRLIHLSTDYVFDGQKNEPYLETDQVNPLSVYGQSKLEGERLVLQHLPQALVARTSWVFGAAKESFVERPLRQYQAGQRPQVVDDQISSPTFAPDLAKALLKLCQTPARGLCHVAGSGFASRLQVALASFTILGLNPAAIVPAKSSQFPGALRPAFSALNSSRAAACLGYSLPLWSEALSRYWRQLKAQGRV